MEQTENVSGLLQTPEVLGVVGLNESAVRIRIVGKCQVKKNWAVERELRVRIKQRFDQEQISIPFPQRTVHITKE